MEKKRLPRSIRKFIRKEKARLRRLHLDEREEQKAIEELYKKFIKTRQE